MTPSLHPTSTTISRPAIQRLCQEDEILFTCTRKELLDEHRQKLRELCCQALDWDQLFLTAVQHGVAPLVYVHLQECDDLSSRLPSAVRKQFEECLRLCAVRNQAATQRTREILDYFRSRSIDVMLVKGAALDHVLHDRPWYTMSEDIDLVVNCDREQLPESQRALAHALLCGHQTPLQRLVKVEAEWLAHHDISMNDILPVDFSGIWRRARAVNVLDLQAFVMAPEDLFIVACIQSCRRRYYRLKSLYEVAEIIRAWELDWTQICERAKRWKCGSIVYAALYTAQLSVGCRVPDHVFDQLAVGVLRRWLIHYLSVRMSFSSLSQLNTGHNILGRRVSWALMLPYATYDWPQTFKHLSVAWSARQKK